MSKVITSFVGLDVHYDSIALGVAPVGREPPHFVGTVAPQWVSLCKALSRLGKREGLQIVYEAGPCGFGIARRLKQLPVPCLVAAPSLIPKAPGSPFKTDKRDARAIARLLRAGELTAVYIPEPTDEAIRDLCRARTDAVDDLRRCRHRLKGFLLRHG